VTEPRAYTLEEVQKHFLQQVWVNIHYWGTRANQSRKVILSGLAHSILVILDGESDLPAFEVMSRPHPDDEEWYKSQGENWYPSDCDIAGNLHERLYMAGEEMGYWDKGEISGGNDSLVQVISIAYNLLLKLSYVTCDEECLHGEEARQLSMLSRELGYDSAEDLVMDQEHESTR